MSTPPVSERLALEDGTYAERGVDANQFDGIKHDLSASKPSCVMAKAAEETMAVAGMSLAMGEGVDECEDLICSLRIRETGSGDIPPCDIHFKRTCKHSFVRTHGSRSSISCTSLLVIARTVRIRTIKESACESGSGPKHILNFRNDSRH
jgi:hypothetical protein